MGINAQRFQPKGMAKDIAKSLFNPEYAFDIHNMNIISNEDENTLFSLSNEKGNARTHLNGLGDIIYGTPIGFDTLDDKLVLFVAGKKVIVDDLNVNDSGARNLSIEDTETNDITSFDFHDRIIKFNKINDNRLTATTLYKGFLDFSETHPIESIAVYENDKIQKIYWTDGINPFRYINIAKENNFYMGKPSTIFDCKQNSDFNEVVNIEKSYIGGQFSAGIIQYVLTYFQQYGTQSNIFYTSPLLYLSVDDGRALRPDGSDFSQNCFEINIQNADYQNFQYIRIYAIQFTSYNGTPSVRMVADIPLSDSPSITFTDNGIIGEYIEPTDLLYLGMADIICQTMNDKDGTLFLGDITQKNVYLSNEIKSGCRELGINWVSDPTRGTPHPSPDGLYPYVSQLDKNSREIKTWKCGETYRFGLRFLNRNGQWSDVAYIEDSENILSREGYNYFGADILPKLLAKTTINDTLKNKLLDKNYIKARPVYAEPTLNDRTILTQGMLCPTVYNLMDRLNNQPYAQPSWFTRPIAPDDPTRRTLINQGQVKGYIVTYTGWLHIPSLVGELILIHYGHNPASLGSLTSELMHKALRKIFRMSDEAPYFEDNKALPNRPKMWFGQCLFLAKQFERGNIFYEYPEICPEITINDYYEIEVLDTGTIQGRDYVLDNGVIIHREGIEPRNKIFVYDAQGDRHLIGDSGHYDGDIAVRLDGMKFKVYTERDLTGGSNIADVKWHGDSHHFDLMSALVFKSSGASFCLKNIDPQNGIVIAFDGRFIIDKLSIEDTGDYTSFEAFYDENSYIYDYHDPCIKNTLHTEYGSNVNFIHNTFLQSSLHLGSEIQSMDYNINNAFQKKDVYIQNDNEKMVFAGNNKNMYATDQNIVTLNSPEIELGQLNILPDDTKLRIVGMIPFTSFSGDIDIDASSPSTIGSTIGTGFYKEPKIVKAETRLTWRDNNANAYFDSRGYGFRMLVNGPYWIDDMLGQNGGEQHGYAIYPFQSTGSLNNSNGESAILKTKRISNIHVSSQSIYFKKEYVDEHNWEFYYDLKDCKIFRDGFLKILENDDEKEVYYEGYIDKINIPDYTNTDFHENVDDIRYNGFLIKIIKNSQNSSLHDIFSVINTYTSVEQATNSESRIKYPRRKASPISMKYKSSPHAVLSLGYNSDRRQIILPSFKTEKNELDNITSDNDPYYYFHVPYGATPDEPSLKPFWKDDFCGIRQYYIQFPECFKDNENPSGYSATRLFFETNYSWEVARIRRPHCGFLWLGELYRENVVNRYGGTSESALANNKWVVCGEAVNLDTDDEVVVEFTDGDTYYQRFDSLKTYPYSEEDENQIVDIASFMVETHINLDGRYDRNRGLESNLMIRPTNFNLFNHVYNQEDNFFKSQYFNPELIYVTNFPSTITWSKTKTFGSLIDTWTNISFASTLDMDGDKGKITSIEKLNNTLFVLQERAIATIQYNEKTMIEPTQGVPIEIANSGKVTGKYYLSTGIGCQNKWAICRIPKGGIFFMDDINSRVYGIGVESQSKEPVTDITESKYFVSWFKDHHSTSVWNPKDFDNFVMYYDMQRKDIMFISKEHCLSYSTVTNMFSSFYDYESVPYLINFGDSVFMLHKDSDYKYSMWKRGAGDYNMFFGKEKPYSVTVLCNQSPVSDNIFENIEMRSEMYTQNPSGEVYVNETFNNIEVWNEHQHATEVLRYNSNGISNLRKRFMSWHINIPRDQKAGVGLNRMRNPWLYIKLMKQPRESDPNTNRFLLQDIVVKYFEYNRYNQQQQQQQQKR